MDRTRRSLNCRPSLRTVDIHFEDGPDIERPCGLRLVDRVRERLFDGQHLRRFDRLLFRLGEDGFAVLAPADDPAGRDENVNYAPANTGTCR